VLILSCILEDSKNKDIIFNAFEGAIFTVNTRETSNFFKQVLPGADTTVEPLGNYIRQ